MFFTLMKLQHYYSGISAEECELFEKNQVEKYETRLKIAEREIELMVKNEFDYAVQKYRTRIAVMHYKLFS